MSDLLLMLGVFAATFAVGYAMISRGPPMLHTPLMSMTNAISAVTVIAALLLFAAPLGTWHAWLGALSIAAAMFNVVGGFVITDRMLGMFRKKEPGA